MPDQPQQGQGGRRDGAPPELLRSQVLALPDQDSPVMLQPAGQHLPLARVLRRSRPVRRHTATPSWPARPRHPVLRRRSRRRCARRAHRYGRSHLGLRRDGTSHLLTGGGEAVHAAGQQRPARCEVPPRRSPSRPGAVEVDGVRREGQSSPGAGPTRGLPRRAQRHEVRSVSFKLALGSHGSLPAAMPRSCSGPGGQADLIHAVTG